MRNLIGIIIVAPLWGMISTQLFLQSWLAFIGIIINIIGIFRGKVLRKTTFLGLGVALVQVILFSGLLYLGYYLVSDILFFGYTTTENIIYWIFAAIILIWMIPQIPSKIKRAWRCANVPGYIEERIWNRRFTLKGGT